MAKSTTKDRNLKQFPKPPDDSAESSATSTAVEDTPADPPTPFDATPAPQPEQTRKTPKSMTFFQRVASIPREDWGERAKVKLYRLAPLINRLAGSEHKFITIYAEPITEEKIKIDHGSGRYRVYLNYKTAGNKEEKEIDMREFDILDPSYPPKIPPGEWIDDPRNKQWAWARPAGAAGSPPIPAPIDPLAAFDTFMNIQDRVQERMTPTVAPTVATTPPADPFDTAKKIMEMRANDPMVAALMQRLEAMDRAQEAARMREFELQKELRQQAAGSTAAEKPKTLMEQLNDFKAIKDLFSSATGAVEGVVRAGRTTALDVAKDLGSKFLESDLASGVGQYLASLATRNVSGNGAPAQMANPGAVQAQTAPADDFQSFIQTVLNPALLHHYIQGFSGGEFADWLYDGYPNRVAQLQQFTHPMMPGLKGASAIIQAYKHTPSHWPTLSSARPSGEQAFTQFVTEFCAWKPEAEADEPIDTEVVGSAQETEEGPERI